MRKIFKRCALAILATWLILGAITACHNSYFASEGYIRSKAVMLVGPGSCSGEQVIAPSGKVYILTAGHCKDLNGNKPSITVHTADGRVLERAIVAEDPASDLLLLEGVPNMSGMKIADEIEQTQHVRTFTHGKGLPTYKTEGVLIGIRKISIFLGFLNADKLESCKSSKYMIYPINSPTGISLACVMSVDEMVTTAMVVPGSSGGIVVDDAGSLVGVVSATDGTFGYLVTLSDIHKFIENY